jgi:dipeptidyl-peptidase-4
MLDKTFKTFLIDSMICFSLLSFSLQVQSGPDLTVEWIYSEQCKQIDQLPDYFWSSEGWAILYDSRLTESDRTFEKLEPASGKRTVLLDMKKALSGLAKLLAAEDLPSVLPWPNCFSKDGSRALYTFAADLFLLEVKTVGFQRVTYTPANDTCAQFSPDGRKISYVRNNDLYLYDIAEKEEIRLTFDGSENILNGRLSWVYWEEIFDQEDLGYWWSNDSRALVVLQTDEHEVSEIYHTDFQPQTPRVIIQKYPKAGQKNPKVRLGIIELNNPTVKWIDLDQADYEYIVRVSWLPDNSTICVQTMNRSQTSLQLYLVDRITTKAQLILEETDPAWVKLHNDLIFLEGSQFIWASERDGYNHLYRFDLTGQLINRVTSGNWCLRSSGGGSYWVSDAVCGIDQQNQYIYFTALEKSAIERQLYRVKWDGSNFQQISREEGSHQVDFSPDMKYYFDRYSSHLSPPHLTIHKNDGTLLHSISHSDTALLKSLDLQYVKYFTIVARDGYRITAALLTPKNFDPQQKYPVILDIYGGPSAPSVTDQWDRDIYFNNLLSQNGYLVFSMNNRSAAGESKISERTVLKKLWSDIELNDLLDAVGWLKNQPFIDSSRLGIWGWSGGGMHTLLAMTRSREFKAGIAVAPVSDWLFYDTFYTEFAMKTPADNPDGYVHTSLVRRASELHGRLLLVHGTYDDNVHIQNTWAFADELIKHNKKFDMMIYPMRKHGIADTPARIHLYNKMLEFWLNNL